MSDMSAYDDVAISAGMIEDYTRALTQHLKTGNEETLIVAYDVARQALAEEINLADFGMLHHTGLRRAIELERDRSTMLDRAEAFFLEGMVVYDMALRGYQSSISRLQDEVTERKRIEQELRDITFELARQRDDLDTQVQRRTKELRIRAGALEQANRQLSQVNREQSEFTYALSHDLKTPVNTIDGLLQVLLEDFVEDIEEDGLEIVGNVLQTVGRMRHLIDDVLEYSRVIKHRFVPEKVDLQQLAKDVVNDLQSLSNEAEADIDIGPMPLVMGNPFQLRVLLSNLLSNALKYRDRSRTPRINLDAEDADIKGKVRISVTDNGIGIAPEHFDRICELFKRLHTYEEFDGSGIGLALCQRVAENHTTSLAIRSSVGEGSVFSVELKRAGI